MDRENEWGNKIKSLLGNLNILMVIVCPASAGKSYMLTQMPPGDEIRLEQLWLNEEQQVAVAKFSNEETQAILEAG